METLTKTELQLKQLEIFGRINKGSVFVHPTDTIYGLGCDATNSTAVKKLRQLKERQDNPFSVWVPSLKWIKDNCVVDKEGEKWLKDLPGPYTLIFKLKNKNAVAKEVTLGGDSLGVRIPEHWFSQVVSSIKKPIVTTSANKAGQPFMTSVGDLHMDLQSGIDFVIYEGEKKARPSKIIDLTKGTIRER